MSSMHDYRKLRVWEAGRDLALETYRITKSFPRTEIFGLTSQMRRSAVSVAANIAEGAGRGSPADFARFVTIASGSACEYETLADIAHHIGYLDGARARALSDELLAIKRMLHRLEVSLRNRSGT